MSFTFLHAADIHLDSPLRNLQRYDGAPVDAIRSATRQALVQLVDYAIAQRVAFVVIAGDLYDGDWKDFNTGLFCTLQATRLRDAGIPLFLISGNHDAENVMTRSLPFPDNTMRFSGDAAETIRLPSHNVALHGQSFATKAVTQDLSRGYPSPIPGWFNIGLLHTSATGRDGHDNYSPCTLEGLLTKQYQYWALGHVHQREVLHDDGCRITFSGNLQGRHIKETGPKGCWQVTVNADHSQTSTFVPLDCFRWEVAEVDVSTVATEADLYPAVQQSLEQARDRADGLNHAVRIELTGQTSLHERLLARRHVWTNEFRSLGIQVGSGKQWIEKVSFHSSAPQRSASVPVSDLPREELLTYIDELRSQPEALQELGRDIIDLFETKIPADVKLSDAGLDLAAPEAWQQLLEEAEGFLANRLSDSLDDAESNS